MNSLHFEVKGQGHNETTYGQIISIMGGIFQLSPECTDAHGHAQPENSASTPAKT